MNTFIKDTLRELLIIFHIDLTKNLQYDRLTRKIIKNHVNSKCNCVDIGCHKGEILDLILKYAPEGNHYAFEPLPILFDGLKQKFKNRAKIFPYALSDYEGKTSFQFVKNAPAYSGIKRRRYDISDPEIEEITVELRTLDSIIDPNSKIDFIKIDVEGAEFGVLKGGHQLLKKNKPIVLFECGKGASDYYVTSPLVLYNFLTQDVGLNIYTLSSFISHKHPLNDIEFNHLFNSNKEYYFVAN